MARLVAMGQGSRGEGGGVGVLLVNVGSPRTPTPRAVRRFLAEFLGDRRVVELPRPLWWPILHLAVLPWRAPRSARLYASIWTPEGPPLVTATHRQARALAAALRERFTPAPDVAVGMRYGEPSLAEAVANLLRGGCRRLLVLPLFPQYASATTGSVFAAVTALLARHRRVPELRFVSSYHDDPGYIDALAASIHELWGRDGEPERLLLSFHGIPAKASAGGDPYSCQCRTTGRLVLERLGWPAERAAVTFQSRFGRAEWLAPHTEATLREWAAAGVRRVDVVCPGFAADCLETLEEIAVRGGRAFLEAGGTTFRYVPALGDRPDHIAALAALCQRHLAGWAAPRGDRDETAAAAEREPRAGATP